MSEQKSHIKSSTARCQTKKLTPTPSCFIIIYIVNRTFVMRIFTAVYTDTHIVYFSFVNVEFVDFVPVFIANVGNFRGL